MQSTQRGFFRAWPLALILFVAPTGFGLQVLQAIEPGPRDELLQARVAPETSRRILGRQRLTLADIVELSRRSVANSTIIYCVYVTRTHLALSSRERRWLQNRQVSPDVVTFLIENRPENLLRNFFSY